MPGRNDPCPCGSGRKYKRCCEAKRKHALPGGTMLLAVGVIVILVVGIAMTVERDEPETPSRFAASPSSAPLSSLRQPSGPVPQPPGPAPAGKVWSTEHGHWHDAGNPQAIRVEAQQVPVDGQASTTPSVPVPKPPGPAPAGKVWSADHGHWHDVSPNATKRDPGPVTVFPDGRVGTRRPIPQPTGPAPEGKVWSAEHGHWHDAPGAGMQ